MAGGVGPCRFGYYGQIQNIILEDLGYNVDFVLLDHPRYGIRPFIKALQTMAGGRVLSSRVIKVASLAWKVLRFTEDLEAERRALRAQVKDRQKLDEIVEGALEQLRQVNNEKSFQAIKEETMKKLDNLERKETEDLIKVGIVGEIYVAQETKINFNVEKILGELGAYVHNSVSTVEYVLHTLPFTRSREN